MPPGRWHPFCLGKSAKDVDIYKKVSIIIPCMDMRKEKRITAPELISWVTGRRIVVGTKQIRKTLQSGTAQKVFLAENADPVITDPIAGLCKQYKVNYAWVKSMTDLGRACGIEVGAAAAAVVD